MSKWILRIFLGIVFSAFFILVGLFVWIGIDAFIDGPAKTEQQQVEAVATVAAEENPDTMSIGKKLLVVDTQELLSESDPRVLKVNEQIASISQRFGDPEELVADKAVTVARIIRKETGGQELISDTLDSALVATMGLDNPGDLSTVLALYATSRTTGSDPDVAKRVAYAFLHVNENALK